MPALPDQRIHHEQQRGIGSFQVSRQEPDDTPVFDGAIESFESGHKAFFIQAEIFHFVEAAPGAGSPAGFEYGFGGEIRRFYGVGLEKGDREERELRNVLYPSPPYPHLPCIP